MRVFYSCYSNRQQKLSVAIGISMPKRILEPMIRLVMLLNPHRCGYSSFQKMVAGTGIEPVISAYEAGVMPLHYPAIKNVAGFSMKDGTTKKTPLPW